MDLRIFVKIGPELAINIVPSENMDVINFWKTPMLIDSMFIFDVNKKNIIYIVDTFANNVMKSNEKYCKPSG